MSSTYPFNPDYAVPPGETLGELIDERGMTQNEVAIRTGLSRKTINEILSGKAPLTPDTAQKLELVFQTPARFWNEHERLYRQHIALKEHEKTLEEHRGWEKNFPYSELAARQLVPATGNVLRRIWNLCGFFGISRPQAVDQIFADLTISGTLFRRQSITKSKPYLAWTWLRVAEIQARKIESIAYREAEFVKCIRAVPGRTAEIRDSEGFDLFRSDMIESFRLAGVALVFVPEFSGAAINGAAFWQAGRPVIALTLRGKRLDGIIFTLLHEAAHILHHGKKTTVIDAAIPSEAATGQKIENEADRVASAWCIPDDCNEEIKSLRTADELDRLGGKIRVHRDLIIGRYARLTGDYRRFSSIKLRLEWKRA